MYWLLDILIVALIALAAFGGVKKGFVGMLSGVGAFFLKFVCVIIVTGLFVLLMQATGVIDALTLPLVKAFGESSLYESKKIANIVATAIFALIGISFSWLGVYLVVKFIKSKQLTTEHATWDTVVGGVVAGVLALLLIYIIYAFIHAVVACGGLPATDELLRACPISGLLYRYNPFNAMFGNMSFIQSLVDLLKGNF